MADPQTPQIRVTFPLSGLEMTATGLKVRMAEYAHDIAQVTFLGRLPPPAVTGDPVYIAWGPPTSPTAFFGYYDHLSSDPQSVTVVCVGSSYVMKSGKQNVWTDVSADVVAYEISDSYQLDADITSNDRVFQQIAQSGESDWQFLCRVAKSVGYTCYVHQTQVRFHPRTRDFVAMQDYCPIFGTNEIFGFSAVLGNSVPNEQGDTLAVRQLAAIDNTGDLFTAADVGVSPLAGSVGYTPTVGATSHAVVDSVAEALATLTAQREMNRFHITADVIVSGSTLLRQAMPVYLGNLSADHTGYWYVLSAEHRIIPTSDNPRTRYTVALKLGRDSQGQSVNAPTSDPLVKVLGMNPATGIGDVSSPRLVMGRWQASRAVSYLPPEDEVPDFVRSRHSDVV